MQSSPDRMSDVERRYMFLTWVHMLLFYQQRRHIKFYYTQREREDYFLSAINTLEGQIAQVNPYFGA